MTFEEAVEADRKTALSIGIKQDMRLAKAQQATASVLHFLRDYIDEDRWQDAYGAFFKAMYEAEFEVVSRAQMTELEQYRDAILDKARLEALLAPIRIPAEI